jgi:hypothetical protein
MSVLTAKVSSQFAEGFRRVVKMKRMPRGALLVAILEEWLMAQADTPGWAEKWERAWGEKWEPDKWIGWPVERQQTHVDWRRNPRMWFLTRQDLKIAYRAWMNGRTLGEVVDALRRPTREKLTKAVLLGLWETLGFDTKRREKFLKGRALLELEEMKERWPVGGGTLRDIALIVAQERGINLMVEAERILGPETMEGEGDGKETGSGNGEPARNALRMPK